MASKAKHVIKCFCNCSVLTKEDVQHFNMLSAQGTLKNERAGKMLRSYLEKHQIGDVSEAMQMLNVYEKCNEYLNNQESISDFELDELTDLGIAFNLVQDLGRQIQTEEWRNIKSCLERIQEECWKTIECSAEFKRYKKELRKKIRQFSP